jgi:hypothetical protein
MSATFYCVEIDLDEEQLLGTLVGSYSFDLNFVRAKYKLSPYWSK